jgi:N-acetylglucosaminyl-diphospho-decaprenol L-rhamnosyltransferase
MRDPGSHGRDPLGSATVVVVDWDLPDVTIRCVEALVGDGVSPARIVLVENGSTDENVERLGRALPNCPLVRLERNRGYARAANLGAEHLPGDAYLFVNNDAFVHRAGSVGHLLERLERDGVGVAVPRLLNEDLSLQPNVVPLMSPLTALVGAIGVTRLIPNRLQPLIGHHWDHSESRPIRCANGTVLAVTAECWRQLGGWAERELMFAEDLDLCWRAHRAGWSIWFESAAEFVHLGNTSVGRQWSDRRRAQMVGRAEGALIRDELSPAAAAATLFFKSAGVAARIAFFTARRDRQATESLRGVLSGYLQRR